MARTATQRWRRLRELVLNADPLCAECRRQGRTVAAREVDHIVPVHQGGTDARENLQGLCRPCHWSKTATEARDRRTVRGCDVDGTPLAWLPPGRLKSEGGGSTSVRPPTDFLAETLTGDR